MWLQSGTRHLVRTMMSMSTVVETASIPAHHSKARNVTRLAQFRIAESGDNDICAENSKILREAADVLNGGGVVAAPTDTVYGFFSLLEHSDKLYNIKRRSELKPLGLCVADPDDVYRYALVTISDSLLRSLLPGPVTLVFPLRSPSTLPSTFNPQSSSVGVRIMDHWFVRNLCRLLDHRPLAQTSANLSGDAAGPTNVQDFCSLWPQVNAVYDDGPLSRISGDQQQRHHQQQIHHQQHQHQQQICNNETNSAEGSTVVDLSPALGGKNLFRIRRDGCARAATVATLEAAGLQLLE